MQQPRPRTLIGGGAGPKLFAHIAEYADGWMPIGGSGMKQAVPALRRALEDAGRDPSALHVVPIGVFPDAAKLAFYTEVGATECVLRLPSAPRDDVLRKLDEYATYL